MKKLVTFLKSDDCPTILGFATIGIGMFIAFIGMVYEYVIIVINNF